MENDSDEADFLVSMISTSTWSEQLDIGKRVGVTQTAKQIKH